MNMKYPKINTIWKRDKNNKFNIIHGEYSCPEFENIKKWHTTEKIDGTNIRIIVNKESDSYVTFAGRTDKAQIPSFLLTYLQETFTKEKLKKQFEENNVILYGEGYGGRIQRAGKKYKENVSFILFDAFIITGEDSWWIDQENVKSLAKDLNIEHVPELGIKTTEEIISMVKDGFESTISKEKLIAEGIVARSHPLMLFRNKKPLMWKLKNEDYRRLEKDEGK